MYLLTRLATWTAPWVASILGDPAFELMVMGWLAALLLLQRLVLLLAHRPPVSPLKAELVKRPTVVPVTVHSLVVTLCAVAVILPPGQPTVALQPWGVHLWRRGVLPFSTAYWLFDIYNYCWPKQDALIALHHVIILLCNYPVGDNAGIAVASAQLPACNFVMMSTNGYVLEATTFLLYIRWFLTHHLQGHHWAYSLNNTLLLFSWVSIRLLYAPFFLYSHLWETCPVFRNGALLSGLSVVAYVLMIVMSAVWLLQMLKNGIADFLVLRRCEGTLGAVPAFGSKPMPPPSEPKQA